VKYLSRVEILNSLLAAEKLQVAKAGSVRDFLGADVFGALLQFSCVKQFIKIRELS
jgi:hypothetical protein